MSASGDDEDREWCKEDECAWLDCIAAQDDILRKAHLKGGLLPMQKMTDYILEDRFYRAVGGKIHHPGLFHVILAEGWNCLEALMRQINTFYALPKSNKKVWPYHLRPGFNVAVQLITQAGRVEMYRAKILRQDDRRHYFVYLWDYGDVDRVHIRDIRYISKEHVRALPAQAIPCIALTGHTGSDSDCPPAHGERCKRYNEPMCSDKATRCNPLGALDTCLEYPRYIRDRDVMEKRVDGEPPPLPPPNCKDCDSIVWTKKDKRNLRNKVKVKDRDIYTHFLKPVFIEDLGKGWEVYVHLGERERNKIIFFHLERKVLSKTHDLTFSREDLKQRRLTTDTDPDVRPVKEALLRDVYAKYSVVGDALAHAKFDEDDGPKYPMPVDPSEVNQEEEKEELTEDEKKLQQWKASKPYRQTLGLKN